MTTNNYVEIKYGSNKIATYNQENLDAIRLLRQELNFWRDKCQEETGYYKALIEKMLKRE